MITIELQIYQPENELRLNSQESTLKRIQLEDKCRNLQRDKSKLERDIANLESQIRVRTRKI